MHPGQQIAHAGFGDRDKKLRNSPSRRFWLKLAREWFHCTVEECQARVDSRQFTEILADYLIEPWGSDWHQTAKICETIALSQGTKKLTWLDFMPPNRLGQDRKRRMTDKEIMDVMAGANMIGPEGKP